MKLKIDMKGFTSKVKSMIDITSIKESLFPDFDNMLVWLVVLYFYMCWLCVLPAAILIAFLCYTEVKYETRNN